MSTEGNIEKLPKWAQHDIALLKREIAEQAEMIGRLRTVVTNDCHEGIVIDPYGKYPIHYHPTNTIRLWVKPNQFAIDVSMRKSQYGPSKEPGLIVSGYGLRGTGCIVMSPIAGNVIHIGEGER
jgi:hypothetical protein